jgi:serine/threonine-protein kinase
MADDSASDSSPSPTDPEPKKPTRAPEQQSVLSHISELIGNEPKVLLRENDGDEPMLALGTSEARERPFLSQRFQILGEVARGGVGVILKGHDLDLGRAVAIKVLSQSHMSNPAMVERFVEEAQIGGQLQHPGIVPVYELGQQEDRRPFFAMKLIKGRTLAKLLSDRKDRRQNRQELLSTFHRVCQTVAYAHSRGVIHRDLKPANIMVGAFGEVQVVDWGLAKVLTEGGVADERRERRIEQTEMSVIETIRNRPGSTGSDSMAGSVMGTPGYMPPEQANGQIEKLDESSDVFALGAILCQILTAEGPYVGDPEEVYMQAVHARLDDAFGRLDRLQVDAALIELAKDCLAPPQRARPRDAGEVAQRIGEYLSTSEERAHAAEISAAESRVRVASERKARRLTLALAASLLVAGAVGVGSFLFFEHQKSQRTLVAENAVSAECEEVRQILGEAQSADIGDFTLLIEAQRKLDLARELAQDPAVSDATRERVESLGDDLNSKRARSEEQAREQARNDAMLVRLEEIRTISNDYGWGDAFMAGRDSYSEAFRDYGMDVARADLDEATSWISEQPIAIELASALDDWGSRQRFKPQVDVRPWQELVILAQAADPDEPRNEIRDAILADDVEALIEIASSADLRSLPAATLVCLADALREARRPDQALHILRQAHTLYPDDYAVNSTLGFHLEDLDLEAASRYYAAALASRPESILATANLGWALSQSHYYDEALVLLESALRQHPDNPMLKTARAELAIPMLELDLASDLLTELKDISVTSELLQRKLATVHFHNGRFGAAAAVFEEINTQPGTFNGGLGQALVRDGRQDQGYQVLRESGIWGTFILCCLLYEVGRFDDSLLYWQDVLQSMDGNLRAHPDSDGSHRSLSWALSSHPNPSHWRPDRAVALAERAVALNPQHPHNWAVLVAARYRSGDWIGVLGAHEGALQPGADLNSQSPYDTMDFLKAAATWQLGGKEQAVKIYEAGVAKRVQVANPIFWVSQESFRCEVAKLLGLE